MEKLEGRESLDYAFVLANMIDLHPLNEVGPDVVATLKRAAMTDPHAEAQDKLCMVRIGLASIYASKRKYHEAERLLLNDLDDLEQQNALHTRSLIRASNALAELRFYQGRYSESLDLNRQFLQLSETYYGREHPVIALALANTRLESVLHILAHSISAFLR